jgi:thiamine pyrophosphate-dependent acetolactate synthase large subunit-like protein
VLNSLRGSKIKLVTSRYEQAAGFMAATYGRAAQGSLTTLGSTRSTSPPVRPTRNYRNIVANTLLLDNALATMGAGLPAALIHPDRTILAVCGDDGSIMNAQEMGTAVRLGVNITVLILEGRAYGMIRWKQEADASSYGANGSRVASAADFLLTLKKALGGKA